MSSVNLTESSNIGSTASKPGGWGSSAMSLVSSLVPSWYNNTPISNPSDEDWDKLTTAATDYLSHEGSVRNPKNSYISSNPLMNELHEDTGLTRYRVKILSQKWQKVKALSAGFSKDDRAHFEQQDPSAADVISRSEKSAATLRLDEFAHPAKKRGWFFKK